MYRSTIQQWKHCVTHFRLDEVDKENIKKENILSIIVMTQVGSILVVDVTTPSLVSVLLFLCSRTVTKKTTIKSTPSNVS
jgi:hypothetical protein